MKNHRFLWLRNRTTDNRKCEKARNIKEKRTIEMFSTASRLHVALRSSRSVNIRQFWLSRGPFGNIVSRKGLVRYEHLYCSLRITLMLSAGIVHTADPLTVALPSSRVDAEAPCTVLAADMVAETSAPTPGACSSSSNSTSACSVVAPNRSSLSCSASDA